MVICHLCLNGPYNEGWNYQENILPKYHVEAGFTVYQLVAPCRWENGEIVRVPGERYTNKAGVRVIRLQAKKCVLGRRFDRYPSLPQELSRISPDILFVHDCQSLSMAQVAVYLKNHPDTGAYVDSHADHSNSARNWFSRAVLHRIIWRHYAKLLLPYVKKFYGVLPARVDFLIEMYGIPREKCELLVMGADDELTEKYGNEENGRYVREKHHLAQDDFLLVTGGKIDRWKKQTVLLMEAVRDLRMPGVKLIVFGSVEEDLKRQVEELAGGAVIFIGWISPEASYRYFAAADLAVFPGRHSVFWEQAAGQGVPMICKDWEGTHHVDVGGNVRFISGEDVEEMKRVIREIAGDPAVYARMKEAAEGAGRRTFSYREIARRCIGDAENPVC